MASRHSGWLRQGERDLAHARRSLEQQDYEWFCFAAQQGAEGVFAYTGRELAEMLDQGNAFVDQAPREGVALWESVAAARAVATDR